MGFYIAVKCYLSEYQITSFNISVIPLFKKNWPFLKSQPINTLYYAWYLICASQYLTGLSSKVMVYHYGLNAQ